MVQNQQKFHHFLKILSLLLIVSIMAGCSLNLPGIQQVNTTPVTEQTSQTPVIPQAEVIFTAKMPSGTPAGQGISLDILDELTGLALNPQKNLMSPLESGVYSVKIVAPVGAVLKYRYSRIGSPPAIEYTATGKQIRYRLFSVSGPSQVDDEISAWTDLKYTGSTGRIQGIITDSSTNQPIPGLLVEAAGNHGITTSEGSFLLEGLPPGKHLVFVYSLDGNYEPFQQEAIVGENATTPAPISIKPTRLINVTFVVSIPESTLNPLPVRLIGNLYSLGNTFSDLKGGLSTIANRAPLLSPLPDGRYTLTLSLPAGMHLQYKYSLGDGFWNAEHTPAGNFKLREIILPGSDVTFTDVVDTWNAPNSESATFSVTVPDNTPGGDYVSIQFNPFGWTEPIPMWPMGNNHWIYTLYSPLDLVGNIGYRYCRNDVCGAADDATTMGNSANGWPFTSSLIHQDFEDEVKQWAWWQPSGQPTTVVASNVQPRGAGFITGVKLQAELQPSWLASIGPGIQNVKDLGANWVFFSPTFRFTQANPPVLEAVPGKDIFWQDGLALIKLGQTHGLYVGLHAQTIFDGEGSDWWATASRDTNWWANWFARYRTFAINFADMASETNASALVLGDLHIMPAYPGGSLPDGNPSNVPGNADQLWRTMIAEIRQHYRGLILWNIPSPSGLSNLPAFLDQVDGIMVSMTDQVASSSNTLQSDLTTSFGALLDSSIKPIQDQFGKPIVLTIAYPSTDGGATGCVNISTECISFTELDQPIASNGMSVPIDLQEQVDVYNAFMLAVNLRPWVNGVVSDGFFAPAVLQDTTSSVHGKPASDILWYWYHELTK